jgi:outer membrane protein assembly factor BamE (lipoprotein component of BamABCDE complex)
MMLVDLKEKKKKKGLVKHLGIPHMNTQFRKEE